MNKTVSWSDFETLAYYYSSLMDGDTHLINDAYRLLQQHNLVDKDCMWIEEDE